MEYIVDQQQRAILKKLAADLFSPRTPVDTKELFAGRYDQIIKIQSTIAQNGAHAIVYGERGAGKTSLANIAPIAYSIEFNVPLEEIVSPKVNCDGTDTFDLLWRKVFRQIEVTDELTPIGFLASTECESCSLLDALDDEGDITPDRVVRVLKSLAKNSTLVITLDEFDRLPSGEAPRLIADTIKALSDNNIHATIVVVGVGDSVGTLVHGHESIGRHLIEVPMPRMSRNDLEKIVIDRMERLEGMELEHSALKTISLVCTGLPYFTKLLAMHAVFNALDAFRLSVTSADVNAAMSRAIDDSEIEMKSAYYDATKSRHPNSTFRHTLAACALTQRDEFGYFTAANVRDALAVIKGAGCSISNFLDHLTRFCDRDKGQVLDHSGEKHQRRFRFHDPLMQPFVIIRSLDEGVINIDHIKGLVR